MRILVGTSGFSYPAWRGTFYPEHLGSPRMLAWYAHRLPAVEVNNTFYRMPSPRTFEQWRTEVPPGFTFALKAPQRITHLKRLRDVEEPVSTFVRIAAQLGTCLGPVLFQLPPQMHRDVPRLQAFLETLPPWTQAAFEFRHPSWFDDAVLAALAARGAALCVNQSEDLDAPLVPTGSFGYLRLRRPVYDRAELGAWADQIRAQPWKTAYVFFKHEDAARGPQFALQLATLLHEQEGTQAGASP